jgi:tetratricopeptide (TPR) repeat protein
VSATDSALSLTAARIFSHRHACGGSRLPAGMASYSLTETARILQISPARLRYWERTALLQPSARSGSEPAFGFRDLVSLRRVVALLGEGVPLARIRRSVARVRERMPELGEPLGALRPWRLAPGRMVLALADALVEPDGQLVLDFRRNDEPEPRVRELAFPPAPGAEESPRTALAWFERGCVLDEDPKTSEEAARAYRRALALEPDFADAHCNLGTLYYHRGAREEARFHYAAALRLDPRHLEANFNLGNLLQEEGRRESALRHYKRALETDPFFAEAHLNLALLYENLGLPRTARDHWRRYLQQAPEGSWSETARERLWRGSAEEE